MELRVLREPEVSNREVKEGAEVQRKTIQLLWKEVKVQAAQWPAECHRWGPREQKYWAGICVDAKADALWKWLPAITSHLFQGPGKLHTEEGISSLGLNSHVAINTQCVLEHFSSLCCQMKSQMRIFQVISSLKDVLCLQHCRLHAWKRRQDSAWSVGSDREVGRLLKGRSNPAGTISPCPKPDCSSGHVPGPPGSNDTLQ